ncbi:hypothetical protein RHGRI_000562 [Rhododendron griersonianum]|uniref:protein-serine/threonine phosphatase n=1 Tax=Rhododendron griersonianum TaxID=479676 RepID=A0AAV6LH34_9ERIC|nr:hypothetical protein RHGRI_000562 [Rhododendron griersonianum]
MASCWPERQWRGVRTLLGKNEIARIRNKEWPNLLCRKKLYLLLDLDYTLLNSTRLQDVTPDEANSLRVKLDHGNMFWELEFYFLIVHACDNMNHSNSNGVSSARGRVKKLAAGSNKVGDAATHHRYVDMLNNKDISNGKVKIFRLDSMNMLTKLRPFVRTFLKEASKLFEMDIYTMGKCSYALQMAKSLDQGYLLSFCHCTRGLHSEISKGS